MLDHMMETHGIKRFILDARQSFDGSAAHIEPGGSGLRGTNRIRVDANCLPSDGFHLRHEFSVTATDIQKTGTLSGEAQVPNMLVPALPAISAQKERMS